MKWGSFTLVVASVAAVSGCAQSVPAPNVDVRLPENQVGRWTIQRMGKPEFGSEQFIFLDTASGTVCVLTTADIAAATTSTDSQVRKIKPDECGVLPQ